MRAKIWTVLVKEVTDNLRDGRSLAMALLMPLLGPAMLALMIVATAEVVDGRQDEALALPVLGAEHAPHLLAFLAQHNVSVKPAPADPEEAVRKDTEQLVLVIPEEFGGQLNAGRPAALSLVFDKSDRASRPAVRRTTALIRSYGRRIGAFRLWARGIHPALTEAVVVETIDVSTPESRAAIFLAMIPMFTIMAVFMGGYYVAIDATAGERERGSLEPLITKPIERWALLCGKLGATWLFCVVCLALMMLGFAAVTRLVPISALESLGIERHISPTMAVGMGLIVLPLTLFVSCLQMVMGSFCRSFKEAQTYFSVLPLVAMAPGIMLGLMPIQEKTWMMLVPSLSQQLLVFDLLRGKALPLGWVFLSGTSTAILAVLLGALAVRLYAGERIAISGQE